MASTSLFRFFVLLSLLAFSFSPLCCGENVTVSVYYETLCPYCADFIANHLVQLFDHQRGLISIVNLRMIPWGNAVTQPDGSMVCQHGPDECLLNTIEACTITIYPDVAQHFSFIHCVERLSLENRQAEWLDCFELSRLGRVPVDCQKSGYGNLLEKNYSDETAQLNPPHRFVPWVVVDGQPLQEDFMNIKSYICRAYKGTQVPEACQTPALSRSTSVMEKSDSSGSVCYAAVTKN